MADDPFDIPQINRELRAQGAAWTAARTTISELSQHERRLRLGAVPPPGEPALAEREAAAAARAGDSAVAAGLPSAVDLRSLNGGNYVTPIKDQANCGSCVAFGSIAAIESTARVAAAKPTLEIDLSEAHLFYCHGAADNRRCNTGWWVDPALAACRDLGIVNEAVFPYVAGDQACKVDASSTAARMKIVSFKKLASTDEMKQWLATNGALTACFSVYEDFYTYRSGVYRHTSGALEGGHCVCIIGYDDVQRCWIAKNSWGTGWGEGGVFRIAYGDCGIDAEMWGVEVPTGADTGTWLKKRKITGVWVETDSASMAAYIAGVGWKHLAGGPNARDLLMLLTIARSSAAPVDLRLVDGVIHEAYLL